MRSNTHQVLAPTKAHARGLHVCTIDCPAQSQWQPWHNVCWLAGDPTDSQQLHNSHCNHWGWRRRPNPFPLQYFKKWNPTSKLIFGQNRRSEQSLLGFWRVWDKSKINYRYFQIFRTRLRHQKRSITLRIPRNISFWIFLDLFSRLGANFQTIYFNVFCIFLKFGNSQNTLLKDSRHENCSNRC